MPNVTPAIAKNLENTWRFPGEFLEILSAADGTSTGHQPRK
jgi:hypothetical protein